MAFGISFGKIKLQDNDTIFSISYNGTVRFIINKATGYATFGAVDGTGATSIVADVMEARNIEAADALYVNASTGVTEHFYVEGDSKMSGYLNMSGGAGAYFKFPNLSTLEKAALTPAEGMVVYDSSLDKLQVYSAGSWVSLH